MKASEIKKLKQHDAVTISGETVYYVVKVNGFIVTIQEVDENNRPFNIHRVDGSILEGIGTSCS